MRNLAHIQKFQVSQQEFQHLLYVPMGKLVNIDNKDGARPSVTCPHFNNNKCFSE